jgi:DNA-directed RNA polymerase subunit RPC12/RpoP
MTRLAFAFFLEPMPLFLVGPLVLIVLPVIVGHLSLRILQPGPRRDWVAGLFFTLALLVGSLVIVAVAGYLLVTFQGFRPGATSSFYVRLSRVLVVLPFGVIYFLLGVKWTRLYLIPVACPRCDLRRLLRAWMQDTRVRRAFFNMRCAECGFEGSVRGAQMGQGCPQCGRRALTVLDYTYYWCLGCGTRLKRLGLGEWKDASSDQDDGPYWGVRRI